MHDTGPYYSLLIYKLVSSVGVDPTCKLADFTVLSPVCYSSASTIDCGGPTPPNEVTVLEPHNTTVSSVIVYQCQSGFTPSQPSSLCGEGGEWSPDPSQVVCVMLPGTLIDITN